MKKMAFFVLLLIFPVILHAATKEYILPSGFVYRENITEEKPFNWIEFILPSGTRFWAVQIAYAEELTLRETIEIYASFMAKKWGISLLKLQKIISCESNWNPLAFNPKDTDGFPKFGILQFHKPTFYGAGGINIWSYQDQLETGGKLMAQDGFGRWPTCSK